MIEIFVLVHLARRIAERAKNKERSGAAYVLLLLGLWFGGEFVGGMAVALISLALNPASETNLALAYVCALPLAIIGAVVAFKIIDARDCRYPPGHCQNCRYNLTGNTSGVCPECGTKIDPPGK